MPCEGGATVTIADNGPGMTQKMLEGLNGGFPIGSIRKRRGLGLGAYIARHKIAAHGGSIVYESRQGVGTTATVTLPAKQEAAL